MGNPSAAKQSPPVGLLPLIIGVTGHRDLREEDRQALETAVRQIFEEIRKKYPQTPLILLSALAEGADRLVARVALNLGIHLVVPLPMRRELYELDFATPASRAEFNELLTQTAQTFALPLLEGHREADIREHGGARNAEYEKVGAYMVLHNQILIALWDGVETNRVGGTSKIVKFQLEGVPKPYAPRRSALDAVESGPVYHIVTPRISNPTPKGLPFSRHIHYARRDGGEAGENGLGLPIANADEAKTFDQVYDRTYQNIDAFNKDVLGILDQAPELSPELERSKEDLFPKPEADNLPTALKALRERYGVANALALHFQSQTIKTLKQLHILVFVAAASFVIYAHSLSDWPSILAFELVVTAAAYLGVYLPGEQQRYQSKYEDYRALAEGMRVQFFWRLANLTPSVADHYLRQHKGELEWIRGALRTWNMFDDVEERSTPPGSGPDDKTRMQRVLTHWVTRESQYFTTAAKRNKEQLDGYESWIRGLLRTSMGLAVILALVLLLPHPWRHQFPEWLHHYHMHGLLLVLIGIASIGAALLHSYAEQSVLSEHAKQYAHISRIFARAEQRLREMVEAERYKDARNLIAELGREALAENGDWVLLHREETVHMPHAG